MISKCKVLKSCCVPSHDPVIRIQSGISLQGGKMKPVRIRDFVPLLAPLLLMLAAAPGLAQETVDSEKAIEQYRQMLKEDPWSNPAMLDVDRGEQLWKTPRGPKNVSLEGCDLGKRSEERRVGKECRCRWGADR